MSMDTAERHQFRFPGRILFVVEDRHAGMSSRRESSSSVKPNLFERNISRIFCFSSNVYQTFNSE